MEKALLAAYRMNSRTCKFLEQYPDRMNEVLDLYIRYGKDCSLAKRRLENGIKDLYGKRK